MGRDECGGLVVGWGCPGPALPGSMSSDGPVPSDLGPDLPYAAECGRNARSHNKPQEGLAARALCFWAVCQPLEVWSSPGDTPWRGLEWPRGRCHQPPLPMLRMGGTGLWGPGMDREEMSPVPTAHAQGGGHWPVWSWGARREMSSALPAHAQGGEHWPVPSWDGSPQI